MPDMTSCIPLGSMLPATTAHSAKLPIVLRDVHPVSVVQVQDCSRRNGHMFLLLTAMKGRGDKHAWAHHSRVRHFNPYFGGSNIGIKIGPILLTVPVKI